MLLALYYLATFHYQRERLVFRVKQHEMYGIIISHVVHILGLDPGLVFVGFIYKHKRIFFAGYVRHLEVANL